MATSKSGGTPIGEWSYGCCDLGLLLSHKTWCQNINEVWGRHSSGNEGHITARAVGISYMHTRKSGKNGDLRAMSLGGQVDVAQVSAGVASWLKTWE